MYDPDVKSKPHGFPLTPACCGFGVGVGTGGCVGVGGVGVALACVGVIVGRAVCVGVDVGLTAVDVACDAVNSTLLPVVGVADAASEFAD